MVVSSIKNRLATTLALLGVALSVYFGSTFSHAQSLSPIDNLRSSQGADTQPKNAQLEELLVEARELFIQRQPIDARSKLLKALKLAPQDYRPHMHLGEYYLIEVGHFRLAHRYLRTAEDLFEKKYGKDSAGNVNRTNWRDHANLLYLLAEARLNLDNYSGALSTLERFGEFYWKDSYPGTRAWVLMKLKRLDEAIVTAQAGLLRGAEPGRTYNILGILMSVKENRNLSLDAFSRAIQAERALGSLGQPATPLNNAGEVYRELFQDDLAEAAWLQALKLPDGCDHILPSLNLAMLYIDELRLFQAQRVLDDFVACYAQNSLRSDTEHRALIALARGRIALRAGDSKLAIELLTSALERQQWFGKIGTNANDVQFATMLALAQALESHAQVLSEKQNTSTNEYFENLLSVPTMRFRAWWLNRRARSFAIDELGDLEDLPIRNTDTMLEYPTLGLGIAGYPTNSLKKRIKRIEEADQRQIAKLYYQLYIATNELEKGNPSEAAKRLDNALPHFREIDRLVKAEALSKLIKARLDARSWWSTTSDKDLERDMKLVESLYRLLPSHVRYHGFALPVEISSSGSPEIVEDLKDMLLDHRFEEPGAKLKPRTALALSITATKSSGNNFNVQLLLKNRNSSRVVTQAAKQIKKDELGELADEFIERTFRHHADPPPVPVPKLDIVQGVL